MEYPKWVRHPETGIKQLCETPEDEANLLKLAAAPEVPDDPAPVEEAKESHWKPKFGKRKAS